MNSFCNFTSQSILFTLFHQLFPYNKENVIKKFSYYRKKNSGVDSEYHLGVSILQILGTPQEFHTNFI